jgi:hypothetical protein
MPSFDAGGTLRTPFGKNQYLDSTKDVKSESRTFAKSGIPAETIDGETQKVLQPGTILAVITSGADLGKVGVYDTTATDGRQTAANIVGINDTFVPWQLLERDVEVSVTIGAFVKEAWCFHYLAGVRTAGVIAAAKTQINGDASLAITFR